MQDTCNLGEREEVGGKYLTSADLSTHASALVMLTLHIRAHEIRSTRDGSWTSGAWAQKAKVP